MNNLTLQKAQYIANQYFTLLIKKYQQQGFNFEIVEKKLEAESRFFIKFSDGRNINKFYEIQSIN